MTAPSCIRSTCYPVLNNPLGGVSSPAGCGAPRGAEGNWISSARSDSNHRKRLTTSVLQLHRTPKDVLAPALPSATLSLELGLDL